ncbi:MAG: hypothetical protein SWK90_15730 [Chloroflexota bacterium]|nr:hypothetical protein [Chloroflexota bacterium]
MRKNTERVAWIVLLTSFFACIGLAVAVPLSIRWYILNASIKQNVTIEVQRPPLSVTLPGLSEPVAIAEDRDNILERTTVVTEEATDGRIVMYAPQADDPAIIATVRLYYNTEVVLSSARSPRFPASRLPHRVALEIEAGRVRINVSNDDGRSTIVEVHTHHGTATLTEGSYEVKVNEVTTEVTVRDGQTEVVNNAGHVMPLGQAERAITDDEQIAGPLPAARNLIVNGDFEDPLEKGWTSYSEQTDPEQPPGSVNPITDAGREAVNFYCSGNNHTEVGIRQEINYDVRDFTSLELLLDTRIIYQNILGFGGCGYLSSECPIIVLIDYKDIYGTDRQWRHGFYTGEPDPEWPLYPWTEQIPLGNWRTYETGNLMDELADASPATIKSITIYASGHSFNVIVTAVELWVQE